jgi:hypothetical protein
MFSMNCRRSRSLQPEMVQFQGETGRSSGSSRLSMDACSTMTMGLLAVGLGGTLMDTTVKTENGAKRNSISPLTLLFSTKFTCLHRCLSTSSTAALQQRRQQQRLPPTSATFRPWDPHE